MKWLKWIIFIIFMATTSLQTVQAAKEAPSEDSYAYYGFEPDIITNYISPNAKTLGYIRVSVELRVAHKSELELVEHNAPLLRDAIIEILGSSTSQEVRSLTGRGKLKEKCLTHVKDLMLQETGKKGIIEDLIFTKYLYQ